MSQNRPPPHSWIPVGTRVVVDGVKCVLTAYINGSPFVRDPSHAGKHCCPHSIVDAKIVHCY